MLDPMAGHLQALRVKVGAQMASPFPTLPTTGSPGWGMGRFPLPLPSPHW